MNQTTQPIVVKDDRFTSSPSTLEGLLEILALRDLETQGHTYRVAGITVLLARKMGVPETDIDMIRQGAMLHDIGKVGIPDSILFKPGPLTDQEWAIMKMHPNYAYRILSHIEDLKSAFEIPLFHHEKWDGSGYPFGLKGEAIPFAARLFSVSDVFDALTSNRPYRPAWSRKRALAHIKARAGTDFDPSIVPVFEQMIEEIDYIL
jgi:HD-GYP domain-containing protein (c-di-GMP phosphodiesterase class II)